MNNLLTMASPQVAGKATPEVQPGDTVRVQFMIVEGERERLQPFQGVIIRRRNAGLGPMITVRRIASHGIGVERTFPLYSPRVAEVELIRRARVRRSRLYFLRDRVGKKARLR